MKPVLKKSLGVAAGRKRPAPGGTRVDIGERLLAVTAQLCLHLAIAIERIFRLPRGTSERALRRFSAKPWQRLR